MSIDVGLVVVGADLVGLVDRHTPGFGKDDDDEQRCWSWCSRRRSSWPCLQTHTWAAGGELLHTAHCSQRPCATTTLATLPCSNSALEFIRYPGVDLELFIQTPS